MLSSYFAQPHPNPSPKERELVDESEDQSGISKIHLKPNKEILYKSVPIAIGTNEAD
jgi:hypothetical protein